MIRNPRIPDFVCLLRSHAAALLASVIVLHNTSAWAAKSVQCSGEITGTVDSLVVPSGATCLATDLTVAGNVTVKPGATLQAQGAFTVGGGISVASGATLGVASTHIDITGTIAANNALGIGLVKIPLVGASGTLGGDLSVSGTTSVSVLGLTIGGDLLVDNSGAEGLELGANEVDGTLNVQNSVVVGNSGPSLFAIHSNAVGRRMSVLNNDATGAFEPPFVGGNSIAAGNLVCYGNVPALTNDRLGDVSPNHVLSGKKLGQCAGL